MEKFNNNKQKRNILSIIVLIVAMNGIVLFLYQSSRLEDSLNSKIAYIDNILHNDFNSKILRTQREYSFKVDQLLEIDGVIEAFACKNRDKLYSLTRAKYKDYNESDPFFDIMTFRLDDGSAFLRMHKPQMHGDKLNQHRSIIIDVNREKKRLFGFEIGELKMNYRIVTPIFLKNKYIGLLEIGVSPKKFTNDIAELFNVYYALVVKTKDTKILIDNNKLVGNSEFSLVHERPMFEKIFQLSISKYKNKESFTFSDRHQNIFSIANHLYLLNQRNEVVASILVAYDIGVFQNNYNHLLGETALLTIIVSILLVVLLNISFNRYIKELDSSRAKLKETNENLEKRVQEEVRKNREREKLLLRQSRLSQMGEMINTLAHQWRQPLTIISSIAISLQMKLELDYDEAKSEKNKKEFKLHMIEKLTDISGFVESLSVTINDFRNIYKQNKDKKNCTLDNTVEIALNVIRSSFQSKNIELICDYDSKEHISIFENEIIEVILNILKNAQDNFEEKSISDPKIEIMVKENFIVIYDNGGGISAKIIDSIFDPYFSTKGKKNGTGLGLYMSKIIIEEHHEGKLSVDNRDEGVCFRIELPNITQ